MSTESALIHILQPIVEESEPKDKRLRRIVSLWAKLTPDEQRQFRRHIDGVLPLDFSDELIPTVQAAKILKLSFYKVKGMAERGELPVAKTRTEENFWRQPRVRVLGYLFRRSEIEEIAQALNG